MPMKDVRLAALIAAIAMLVCFAGPGAAVAAGANSSARSAASAAAADKPIVLSKYSKRRAYVAKKSRSAKLSRTKKSTSKVAEKKSDKPAVSSEAANASKSKSELPPTVANARAEEPVSDKLKADEAKNIAALDSADISKLADTSKLDGVQVAAADQLNDVDRSLTEENAVAPATSVLPPVATTPPVQNVKVVKAMPSGDQPQVAKAPDSDPWSTSSLIGKIFVAFGGLLTLASAARMIIA